MNQITASQSESSRGLDRKILKGKWALTFFKDYRLQECSPRLPDVRLSHHVGSLCLTAKPAHRSKARRWRDQTFMSASDSWVQLCLKSTLRLPRHSIKFSSCFRSLEQHLHHFQPTASDQYTQNVHCFPRRGLLLPSGPQQEKINEK